MAKKGSPGVGGFVFNVFNVGFTVFMFILPTIGLVYWYIYIRPNWQAQKQVAAENPPAAMALDSAATDQSAPKSQPAEKPDSDSTGFFSDQPSPPSQITPVAPTPTKPTPPGFDYPIRTWRDASGKFSFDASYHGVIGDKVQLMTEDKQKRDVEIAKLSEDDKQYLRDVFTKKGLTAKF